MVTGKADRVQSLRQAHELLHRLWPGREAPVSAWVAYHQRAARLYAYVATVDPDHRHEAVYWAGYERDQVKALHQPAATPDDAQGRQ